MAIAHTGELKNRIEQLKKNCLSWPLNHPEGFFVLQSHINYSILTLTLVSLYKCGRTLSNKSLINVGLLWAAELNVTKATRLTFKSGSCKVLRKSPIQLRNKESIPCGYNRKMQTSLKKGD